MKQQTEIYEKFLEDQADKTMLAKNGVQVYVATNSFKVRPPAISIEEKVERMGLCAVNFASLETGNGVPAGWLLFSW